MDRKALLEDLIKAAGSRLDGIIDVLEKHGICVYEEVKNDPKTPRPGPEAPQRPSAVEGAEAQA